MARINIPDCVVEFFSYVYPDLDLNRVEFHEGIPKLFSMRKPRAITLGSWTSFKINVHFRSGEGNPCTCEGIALIGHELFHVQDVLSVGRGWGFGLIRLWYLAYVYCGIMSRFGRTHYLEEPAYDIQDRIEKYFESIGLNLSREGPCILTESGTTRSSDFFLQFPSNCQSLVIRKQPRSFMKIIQQSTRRRLRGLFKLIKG